MHRRLGGWRAAESGWVQRLLLAVCVCWRKAGVRRDFRRFRAVQDPGPLP